MSVTVELDGPPAGISLAPAVRGERVEVQVSGFYSSEDGNDLIMALDEMTTFLAPAVAALGVQPAQVDHLLAVVPRSGPATVYCNELRFISSIRVATTRTGIQAGELVFLNDIADLESLDIQDAAGSPVVIPSECGVVLILSHRWRKGVYFDFSVFAPDARPRTADLPRLFGSFLARLLFQGQYGMTEAQWGRLLDWGWFPFVGLTHQHRVDLINLAMFDRPPEPFLEQMCRTFAATLRSRLQAWARNDFLNEQMAFLVEAADQYEASRYLSSVSVLTPRIEGVLRTLFLGENPGVNPTQRTMVSNLVQGRHAHSVLLPARFEEYLRRVYFRAFRQEADDVAFSRNSHGHGVSRAKDYDFIQATVGFLVIDQLYFYLTDRGGP